MKKLFIIYNEHINSRLDRWFRRNVCEIPQSLIEKSIRKGNIKVNNIKEKSSYKLKENDKILIKKINFLENKNIKKKQIYSASKKEISTSSSFFIENNENFAVINKPSGISVQSGTKSKRNIIDILRFSKEFQGCKPYVVHRIDKETSGILIVAKNRKYAQLFTALFRIRKIHKTYLSIVIGNLKSKKGTLEDNLIYYDDKKKIITKAVTHFSVIDSNNNYSLVKLNPVTGRKHQLRKQLLIQGCPVLGDLKYRLTESLKNKKSQLMLHAYEVKFFINNAKFIFKINPPSNFIKTLNEKYLKSYL